MQRGWGSRFARLCVLPAVLPRVLPTIPTLQAGLSLIHTPPHTRNPPAPCPRERTFTCFGLTIASLGISARTETAPRLDTRPRTAAGA